MNGRDTKSILLVTLALLTAAYSPLNIYGDKLQDARRWFARGREAIVVYAYIAVMTNEAARAKLLAEYCGDGRPGIVIGGLLDVFLNPGGGRVAAVSDVLTTMATAVAAKKSPTCPIA